MKNNQKKSTMRKIVPAFGMLMVSASMLATSTYAWFTMNKEVRVTGMEVKTQVGDSLLIATSSSGTGKAADSTFQNGLNQAMYGLVNPVSTINGSDGSFFYTYDANADGSKSADTGVIPYTAVGSGTDEFTVDTVTYKAYLDYVFEIKAINTNTTAQYLNLTGLNLLYDGQQLNGEHAYRVAIFSQDLANDGTAYVAPTTGSAASKIFAPTGFTYFGGTAVSSTTEKAEVSPTVNDTSAGWSKQIAANSTDYTKITVRLWLEGEDNTCFSEKFSEKLDEWTLDLKFDLEADTTNAVKLIGSTQNATANASTKVAALSVGTETAAAYQWYKCAEGGATNNDSAVSGANAATLSTSTAGKYYCVITTAKGTQFRTNSIVVA